MQLSPVKKTRPLRNVVILAALVATAPPLLYAAYIAGAIMDRGYSWREMDWNSDGRTQLREVIAAGDIVPHKTVRGGQRCTHYFAYHSATLVRTDCDVDV